LGIHGVYRDAGGGLIVGGLAYAALFALVPSIVLVVGALYLIIDDPIVREEAIDLLARALPALQDVVAPAVEGAAGTAALSSIVAIAIAAWAASGLYVALTRGMERFFPGERTSSVLARAGGVLLVVLVIVGVLVGVFVSGVLTVVARSVGIDSEWLLAVVGAIGTLVVATGLAYGIYRVIPASPPRPAAARLPALLVGVAIGLMTLLYGLIAPWLISSYQAFGVMASVFVALVWLRVVFLAIVYGAAMARFTDSPQP
jgi:uncharacterized BrkB/YihY/UPF0761 family membrane protein